jgi:hypothetical protein
MTIFSRLFALAPLRHDRTPLEPHRWPAAKWRQTATRSERPDRAAEQQWEDEGGAVPDPKPRRARR